MVDSDIRPAWVSAWIATAPTKDFRESAWSSQPVVESDGAFRHELAIPATGYAAMFAEAVFDNAPTPYSLSTNVRIVGGKSAE
jgi:hypothetical protein